MIKLFTGWSLWIYISVAVVLLGSLTAYAYHLGAISQAEVVGRLNTEIAGEKAATATCLADVADQNQRIGEMADAAATAKAEAATAAARARQAAKAQRERAASIANEPRSASCDEEAEKFRADLRRERGAK